MRYFFSRAHNQIAPKPPCPILFLSAPGIDFNSGAASRAELSKYFVGQTFKRDGRAQFRGRSSRRTASSSPPAATRVTHPTSITMGLGMFLPPIEKEEVKRMYHEAQFELLAEQEYGFDTYFLNPGPGRAAALALLDEVRYAFKCKVMIGKSLASQIRRRLPHVVPRPLGLHRRRAGLHRVLVGDGARPSFLVPSIHFGTIWHQK